MHGRDWRLESPAAIEPLYAVERRRWSETLWWDSAGTWSAVEQARQVHSLPGLVVRDGDGIAGWSFFLVRRGTLHVGAFTARTRHATSLLLDGILQSEAARAADAAMMFAFAAAPGLTEALEAAGFAVEPYHYLERPLAATGGPHANDVPFPGWAFDFRPALASLLARAYGEPTLTRPFVREGTETEWREYVDQLTVSPSCGVLLPKATVLVGSEARLDAAVVATAISTEAAHIAQVAVDPGRRGAGVARGALELAMARMGALGFARVTLLVAHTNAGARAIYAKLGFRERAVFVSAGRGGYPRRLSSPAVETGGVRILR